MPRLLLPIAGCLVALAGKVQAGTPGTYLTDVKALAGSTTCPAGYAIVGGTTPANLNEGSGGTAIYLCAKYTAAQGLTKITAVRNASGTSAVKCDKYPGANGVAQYVTLANGTAADFNVGAPGLNGAKADSINLCPELATRDTAGALTWTGPVINDLSVKQYDAAAAAGSECTAGWEPVRWTATQVEHDAGNGVAAELNKTVSGKFTYLCYHLANPPTLEVQVVYGGGQITGLPGGATCTAPSPGMSCIYTFPWGSTTTLTLKAEKVANDATWDRWDDSCKGTAATCTIVVDKPKFATAWFKTGLRLLPPPNGFLSGGTVEGTCGTNGRGELSTSCTASVTYGESYDISFSSNDPMTAAYSWIFGCAGQSATRTTTAPAKCTVVMQGAQQVGVNAGKMAVDDIVIVDGVNQHCPAGYTSLPPGKAAQDLNQGAGGDFVFACARWATTNAINDIAVLNLGGTFHSEDPKYPQLDGLFKSDTDLRLSGALVVNGLYYFRNEQITCTAGARVPGDLNAGAGKDYIYLCLQRDAKATNAFGTPTGTNKTGITDLDFTVRDHPAGFYLSAPCSEYGAGWEKAFMDSRSMDGKETSGSGGSGDLNESVGGKFLYLCMKH